MPFFTIRHGRYLQLITFIAIFCSSLLAAPDINLKIAEEQLLGVWSSSQTDDTSSVEMFTVFNKDGTLYRAARVMLSIRTSPDAKPISKMNILVFRAKWTVQDDTIKITITDSTARDSMSIGKKYSWKIESITRQSFVDSEKKDFSIKHHRVSRIPEIFEREIEAWLVKQR